MNAPWLQYKYIRLIADRLPKFKEKSSNLFNFRCVICGDSQKKENKSRGYIYERNGLYYYHCHNCQYHKSFLNFLKEFDSRLYGDYLVEQVSDKTVKFIPKRPPEVKNDVDFTPEVKNDVDFTDELMQLAKISQLPSSHPVKKYITSRQIPTPYHSLFRWCPNFMAWANMLLPGKFKEDALRYDEGRIIIPYLDKKGNFYACRGRSISHNPQRYISLVFDKSKFSIFGQDTVDLTQPVYVFEGEFDSCFIKNSIALGGQNIFDLTYLGKSDKFVLVFDNEPHSSQLRDRILKSVNRGFKVSLWPSYVKEKDVNEMILGGYTAEEIKQMIDDNVCEGLDAQARLTFWSKA